MQDLGGPSVDRRKILPQGRKHVQFYNPGPKIWRSLAKNMLISARLPTTSDYDHEYLQNR